MVDNFETAVKRSGKKKGQIVAFSFGKGAYEEAARANADDLDIRLLTIADLLKGNPDIVTLESGFFGDDLPLPTPRDDLSRPSIEELVATNQDS